MATTGSASIQALVAQTAAKYGVPQSLALAVGQRESGFNQNARSSAGAIGVMQLMPATAASLGVNPYDTAQNIDGGVRYLAALLAQFAGDETAAVAAYDWGPGNVAGVIAQPGWLALAPSETQNYVAAILGPEAASAAMSDSGAADASLATASELVDNPVQTVDGIDTGSLLLLTGLGIGAYLLAN